MDELSRPGFGRHLVYVFAKLGLADLLADGPQASDALAAAADADGPTLRRVLRGMVVIGLLAEAADGRFGLTEMGRLLGRVPPQAVRPLPGEGRRRRAAARSTRARHPDRRVLR
jgi:hypothetical protein